MKDEADRVFWAAYSRGKADGKAGRPYDAYDDTVPEQYEQDCRLGYAEGRYDGYIISGPKDELGERHAHSDMAATSADDQQRTGTARARGRD